MHALFQTDSKIGDIVAQLPQASDVFKAYRIDYCCGGNRTLHEAINERDINEETLLKALNHLFTRMQQQNHEHTDWLQATVSELINHIIITHHAYLKQELPAISRLTTKIMRVHGQNHVELTQLHRMFHQLKADLEQHLVKEEDSVFPTVKAYLQNPSSVDQEKILATLMALEEEHETAGNLLKQMRTVTDDYRIPADACTSYRLTFDRLVQLESDMFEHIHIENNILMPRVRENFS